MDERSHVTPRLSVVMPVYNGARRLAATLDSILSQTFTDFELIVVDDGSTDETPAILRRYDDRRLTVLTQENQGITGALIRGCEAARGLAIARHDCGDRSRPERFTKQLAILESEPDVVLVSCYTAYFAPGGETLYVVEGDGDSVRQSLLRDSPENIRSISHHGSAMFRRDAYVAAGGYRREFRVAQDLDLWMRMAAAGRVAYVPEVLYEATVEPGTISARHRIAQLETTRIAVRLRDGATAAPLLEEAANLRTQRRGGARRAEADALYFIASCLRARGDRRWVPYARRAIRRNPLLLRAWLLFVRRLK